MTQLIIDTGAAPNDGTGDPLRTAFTKVNYDFTSVYDAGPVGSNIQITDNRIITINTNGNLVLAPNGIGNVVSNVNILPNMSNIRSLGSSDYRWDSTYTRFLDAGSANITSMNIGNANIGNISTITIDVANIHILGGTNGYVLQTDGTGNLTWTAQTGGSGNGTPGGANTQIQYNDAGTFGGTAGFTFDNVANVLNVPGNVSAGNVLTSEMIIANGEIQSGTGFFTGGYLSVNGTSDLHDTTVTGNLTIDNNNNIWTFGTDGNITLPADGGGTNVNIDFAGVGYTTATDVPTAALTGTGSGMTVDIVASTSGSNPITSVTVNQAGTGYAPGDSIQVAQPGSTGNGTLIVDSITPVTIPSINYANGDPYGGGVPDGNNGAVQINWQGSFSNQGGTPGDTYSTLQFDSNGMPILNGTTAYQQRVDYSPYLQVLAPRVESTDFGIVAGPAIQITGYADDVFYNTPRSAYLSVQDQANATQQWDFGILGNGSNNYSISDRTSGNVWSFDTTGNLTFPDNSGNSWPVKTQRFGMGNIGAWLDGQWTIGEFSGNGVSGAVGIRIDPAIEGYTGITLPGSETSNTQPVQIYSTNGGNIQLQSDSNYWTFNGNGGTIFPTLSVQRGDNPSGTITGQTLLFGDAAQEAIISTPDGNDTDGINSQRLVINPGQGFDSGEGGDIYLWAGRGGPTNGSGGDIKIRGGQGMANGTGGYIRIEGGDTQGGAGYPGYIDITGGRGGTTQGAYVRITGGQGATNGGEAGVIGGYGTDVGGDANITGGFGGTNQGGNINITGGGSALGLSGYGNVNINAGASQWVFDNAGNLTVPGNLNAVTASPAPSINGFDSINSLNFNASGNISLGGGYINGGVATVVTDGINSIALAPGAQMDVYGFPFTTTTRGQLTISGDITTTEALGTWYYQSVGTNVYQLYTDDTYSTLVDASGWTPYTGGGEVAITKQVPAANIVINANGFTSTFTNNGQLNLPGSLTAVGDIGTDGNVYATNIVAEASFSIQTSDFNAVFGGRYGVDTTGGAVTATLPAPPATGTGMAVFFADAGGAYATNNLIINPNGGTIMGASGNMTVSTNNQSVGLFYNGATWRTYNAG